MARAPGGTTSLSSGCGAASNTRRCICEPTTASARPALRSTAGGPTVALTVRHPIKPTSPRYHSAWQPNPGRRSTYRRGKIVQTTGASAWFSSSVLSWRVSITMEEVVCIETLTDALARFGKPDIFNTDQGSQFTGTAFTGVLIKNAIAISMDGKGAWRDNVFVERLDRK